MSKEIRQMIGKVNNFKQFVNENETYDDITENEYYISEELKECLPYLKTVRREIGFDFGRTGIVHQWFDDNDIDIMGMSDLDMYIMYIERNIVG